MKYFDVYSRRIAFALHELGFRWITLIPNEKCPGYHKYRFVDSPEIQSAFTSIQQGN